MYFVCKMNSHIIYYAISCANRLNTKYVQIMSVESYNNRNIFCKINTKITNNNLHSSFKFFHIHFVQFMYYLVHIYTFSTYFIRNEKINSFCLKSTTRCS